ncbi:MAG: hypothetical protein A2Y38_07650 [Spirochaetes bacterium GWB1_59_5]|nr:MAG: hypothetical protein A2Y38_07650 [Spirochaetes bacterium GWB1_59_5]
MSERDGVLRLLSILGAMLPPEHQALASVDDEMLAYCLGRARGELKRFSFPGRRSPARRARRLRRCVARAFRQRGLAWPVRAA